jgi:hypothetical protein
MTEVIELTGSFIERTNSSAARAFEESQISMLGTPDERIMKLDKA